MSQVSFQIEILNVGQPVFVKTARGGYNTIEVAFKNLKDGGKVEGKKLVDFNNKEVFKNIQTLAQGAQVTVTAEKGENDKYWSWVRVDADGATVANPVESSGSAQPESRGYPVSEGRSRGVTEAQRQVYIVRQSSLERAVEVCSHNNPQQVSVDQIIDVAKQFEAFVLGE